MKSYTTIDLTGPAVIAAPGIFSDFETLSIPPASILAAIGAARDADHRGILLTLDGIEGGIVSDCLDVYRALREFSDAGGTVVAFVSRLCMSSGPWLALAADYVVMDEGARMVIHGAHEMGTRTPIVDNSAIASIFASRSGASPVTVAGWLSKFVAAESRADKWADFSAHEALDAGLVDHVGDRDAAEAIMSAALAGVLEPSLRSSAADLAANPSGVAVNSIASNDYACTYTPGHAGDPAYEIAVQGARIRNAANTGSALPAIICSPAGIKIGNRTMDQTWLNQGIVIAGMIYRSIGGVITASATLGVTGTITTDGTLIHVPTGRVSRPFTIVGNGRQGATNTPIPVIAGDAITTADGTARFMCFNGSGAQLTNLHTTSWSMQVVIVLLGSTF